VQQGIVLAPEVLVPGLHGGGDGRF